MAIQKLIMAFVLVLVGVALITQIASTSLTATSKKQITNEAITITAARFNETHTNTTYPFPVAHAPADGDWQANDGCPIASVVYGNSTKDYTLTTDYLFNLTTGVLTLKNSSVIIGGSNSTLIDYTYCGDDYLNSDWGRTVLLLVGGFFALALLAVGIGLFYGIGREANIF